jgi:hypothetical protein
MQIGLDDRQVDVLRALLESRLRELSYEIASADVPSFRRMLRGEREVMRSIRDAVAVPVPSARPVEHVW